MDNPNQPHSYKDTLQDKLVDTMIIALEREEITEDTMSEIAAYILDYIDTITDKKAALPFLKDLSSRWSIFKPILQLEENKLQEQVEDEVTQGVLVLLEHGKIDNAIRLAKSVTSSRHVQ